MMTGATSPQATTSTPENSEAPRENREGLGLVDLFDRMVENRAEHPVPGWLDEAPELTPERFDAVLGRAKVSSPELASLAAKYVDISASDWPEQSKDVAKFLHDVRSLAASVLAQAEPSK
jgi:hypothetical protein